MTLKEVMGIPLIKPNYEDLKFLATLNQLLYVGQAVTTLLNRLRSFLVLLASSLVDREKKYVIRIFIIQISKCFGIRTSILMYDQIVKLYF